MRAYSLGIMIVANTVGSQHAVARSLGFEGNIAGFSTCILLLDTVIISSCSSILEIMNQIIRELSHIPPIRILKNIWHGGNSRNHTSSMFLFNEHNQI